MKFAESEVVSAIDPERVVDLTRSLVKIPSVNPPGEEHTISEFIASWFDKRGHFEVSQVEVASGRPNIVVLLNSGSSRSKEPRLIFNGHMDVVPAGEGWTHDPFGAEIEGGKMFGRGVADMKGALAAIMIAMETLNCSSLRDIDGSIALVAVVDEEKGGYFGTNQVVKQGISGNFAIIGEPTDLAVHKMHKGNLTFELTILGKAAHASDAKNGINAIMKMNNVISEFGKYAKELEKKSPHPLLGSPTFNIGMISGGVKSNVVPDRCKISAERRLVLPETIPEAKLEIEMIMKKLAETDPTLKCELKFVEEVGPSETVGGEEALNVLLQSLLEISGRSIQPSGFAATCDMYYFNNVAKIPTVICGPGSIRDIHKPEESIDINALTTAAKVYALTAFRFLDQKRN